MMMEVANGYYKHFKGNVYHVIGNATNTETYEHYVIYHNIHDPTDLFARPLNNWLEDVWVDNNQRPRFTYLGETYNGMH